MVQHCQDANSPKTLCTLLEVNARVNAALRQCRGQCCVSACMPPYTVWDREEYSITTLGAFERFARWLPKHAGLVSSLVVHQGATDDTSDSEFEEAGSEFEFEEAGMACEQLLYSALQLATSPMPALPTAAAAPAAEGEAAPEPQPQPLPLRLQRYDCHFVADTPTLVALAAAEVQDAHLELPKERALPSLCSAFGRLTSLRQLSICPGAARLATGTELVMPSNLLSVTSKLQLLTQLELDDMLPEDAAHLPPSLHKLRVTFAPCDDHSLADLSHLTGLSDLTWHASRSFRRMRAVLPQQLTHLEAGSPLSVAPIPKLQSAILHVTCNETLELLQDLKSISELQYLKVNVPQSAERLARAGLRNAVLAVKQLTNLTGLSFCTGMVRIEHDHIVDLIEVPLGEALGKLQQLLSLELLLGPSMRNDLLCLTKLTGLTELMFSAQCLDDFLASAVLLSLSKLQSLLLATAQVRTASVLPVVSRLSGLRRLELLLYNEAVHIGRAEVMQLTALTQLTYLKLRPRVRGSDLFEFLNVPGLVGRLPMMQLDIAP